MGHGRLAIHLKNLLEEKDLLNNYNKNVKIQFIDSSNSKVKEKRFFEILKNRSL